MKMRKLWGQRLMHLTCSKGKMKKEKKVAFLFQCQTLFLSFNLF